MQECDLLAHCLFFAGRLANMPGTSEVIRRQYCTGAYTACARRMVRQARGAAGVPDDLFPDQRDKVVTLLRG
jgi:hypothetical protein